MCIQYTRVLYFVVRTRQSNLPISHFNSLCLMNSRVSGQCLYTISSTSVWSIFVYNIKHDCLVNVCIQYQARLSGQCLYTISSTSVWSIFVYNIKHECLVNVCIQYKARLSGQCLYRISSTNVWSMFVYNINVEDHYSLRRKQMFT